MGYVEHLLRGKLDYHYIEHRRYQSLGQYEDVDSCLGVISELEYVLKLLTDNEAYQKY